MNFTNNQIILFINKERTKNEGVTYLIQMSYRQQRIVILQNHFSRGVRPDRLAKRGLPRKTPEGILKYRRDCRAQTRASSSWG